MLPGEPSANDGREVEEKPPQVGQLSGTLYPLQSSLEGLLRRSLKDHLLGMHLLLASSPPLLSCFPTAFIGFLESPPTLVSGLAPAGLNPRHLRNGCLGQHCVESCRGDKDEVARCTARGRNKAPWGATEPLQHVRQ